MSLALFRWRYFEDVITRRYVRGHRRYRRYSRRYHDLEEIKTERIPTERIPPSHSANDPVYQRNMLADGGSVVITRCPDGRFRLTRYAQDGLSVRFMMDAEFATCLKCEKNVIADKRRSGGSMMDRPQERGKAGAAG